MLCAIITGAGSGIGRATALVLAKRDYGMVLVGRRKGKLQETAALIRGGGQGAVETLVVRGDVTRARICRSVVTTAIKKFGRIDALVNVAGSAATGTISQITPALWRKAVDSNLSSVMYLTAAAWPQFKKRKQGVIVNISSMASIDPFPGFAMYGAAKAGLNLFTLVTGMEGAGIGLRAVAIAPGAVETAMLRSIFSTSQIPRTQTMDPALVAMLIADCVTGKKRFKNGQTIILPGPR